MRVLHTRLRGLDHRPARSSRRSRRSRRCDDPRRSLRQPVPLHRVPGHRPSRPRRRRRPPGGPRMTLLEAPAAGNRFVGQRIQRREDMRLLTGHGTYVDDIVVAGMLHIAFLRSDIACGTITNLDVSAARALDGVVAVFTGADLNGNVHAAWVDFGGGDRGRPFRCLAEGDVRFAGEAVALVVAESRYIAEDACDLIELEIDEVPAIVGHNAAL